jgi:type I restriction enzyme S subunit
VYFQEGPGVRKHQYTNSGVKLLNGSNINNNTLDLTTTERYVSKQEANGRYAHFLVDDGDLLIASSGIAVENFDKKIAYARSEHLPLCMNTSTIRFKTLDENTLHLDYFRRFLATNLFKKQLGRLITGSAQLNFGPSHLKQMFVPLPPLEEQKRIAAILDKADAIRRKRQQAIELADQFLRSVFLDMFGDPVTNPKGWEVHELKSVVADDRIVTYGIVQAGPDIPDGVPYIRTGDLKNGRIFQEGLLRTSREIADNYKL